MAFNGSCIGHQRRLRLQGHSLSLTWDWHGHFVRLAVDQKVNFTDDTQQRLSVGWRF